ncbi:dentin sialophosphoprotein-like [Dorcoceras hygrometricum]|uniref:Dentin sialophosphoprotein-like n=1 Tax=Dorcoceras hygrometricum TaxID=472368 RepID=A0A2Z7BY42_9LAMI|nr:dentin sialophosphoprotein-like [Dorcoceras hygrometricum]
MHGYRIFCDLPLVVDSIGIFELKEPYCMQTMTKWFLKALSVIPRGSWGDVDRHFTMIRKIVTLLASRRLAPTSFARKSALQTVDGGRSSNQVHNRIQSYSSQWPEQVRQEAAARGREAYGGGGRELWWRLGIQLAVGPQPLRLRNHNFGLAQRIMVKRLATSPHDHLSITDSACKNQLVVVSVQYGPFIIYIPIRSTTIGKSRVATDPITMHTSWRSKSDITSVTSIGYPRMRASGESSTTKHRLLHASGSHPIPPPNDPKTNQYNQDLGLIHSTNGNHLESPNEGSSIDHQVTIHLHAQNITMFPTNETMVLRIADASLKLGRPYPHFDGPID